VLNADLIETIEATPDTVISLVTGKKYVVREKVEEVIDRIVEFRRKTGVGKILIGNLERNVEE
jgi:flagellar protein FlbD